jgi:xylulokinase
MTRHVLAADLGTTGLKVALVDERGTVRATADEVLPMLTTTDGGVEQDPHGWWQALGRCSRRVIAAAGLVARDVDVVAVTSQYTSTIAVAADGMPLGNVVMWMDARGPRHHPCVAGEVAAARWREIHGMAPGGFDDIGHIAFIRAEWPDVYDAAHAFVEPMDYLAARLTGVVTATQSTMFPMLSVDNRRWGLTGYSADLLAMSGLDEGKLPKLLPLGEPRGTVTAAAAEHLGVAPGALVSGATIDSVTTAVGTGAVGPDACGISVGTTTVMVTHLGSKREDPEHGLLTAPSPLPEAYFLVAENGIGGKALEVFVNQIVYPGDGLGTAPPPDAFERVLAAAAAVPAGARGVLFLPWLVGSMAPGHSRSVRGGFVNLGLRSTRADMARAVLEGVALNAAWLLPHFSRLAARRYDEITLGGGGAASATWGQIFADALDVVIRRLDHAGATNARGAALLALAEAGRIGLGDVPSLLGVAQTHEPDPATRRRYDRLRDALADFHDRSAPFYDTLNATESEP